MLPTVITAIPPMTEDMVGKIRRLEAITMQREQIKIPVDHYLHGGMYVRTIKIPGGVMITGALIKLDTNLVVNGHCMIYTGEEWIERRGYNVIPAAAHRKQVFVAMTDTNLTMFFPSDAKDVKHAEEQFTDEYELLQTRGV